jgi:hypothetical protein
MQQQRCYFKQIDSLEERSAQEALRLKRLAHALEIKREWLLRRARQCEAGSQKSESLRPPGLPPK